MEEMESQIGDNLINQARNWNKTWEKLKQTFNKEDYSLTNFWAYVFTYAVINDINEKSLSNHQMCCESGENPYPIYSAVEEASLHLNQPGAWFEYTPHLAGFPAYKAFVKTEQYGSQFKEGKLVKSHPEWDLCYLQGVWGSAPAGSDSIKNMISDIIQKVFPSTTSEESFMDKLALPTEDICVCNGCKKLRAFLSSHDLREITNTEVEMLFEDSDDPSHGFCEKVKVLLNTLKCLVGWQWGTTHNFLYEWSNNIPEDLYSKKFLSLIDAGLEINSAFPLMLPPNRKVDLILALDYSEGDPFMTLKKTDEYCKKNGLPFPKIDIEDTESEAPSQSCYVFQGDGNRVPDVMHFPLFNNNNQSCEGKVHELRNKYRTRNFFYDKSDLNPLMTRPFFVFHFRFFLPPLKKS
ncbi:hypothetical protein GDO78_007203 [Eleutherodactylus coqui]|uniref:PLA2c domain-containing protein n=1 Tax=Eleutherodactylus coqui TaxID=57060 RepID=A0A8J6FGK0_ELECQ|nr:hypothetical protein GDO78_007203 [Eleutherodactylus coqui]